jgi:hypothetical protein
LGRPGTDNSAHERSSGSKALKRPAARDELTPAIGKAVLGYVPRNLTLKHHAIKPFDVRANPEAD